MKPQQLGMTVAEAVKASRVGRNRLYAAVRSGDLPAIRCGRRLVIPIDSLKQWMAEQSRVTTAAVGR